MEEEATLQPSVDTSSESSSVVKDIDSCSIDQSSPCDQDGIITSTSILCSGIVNEEKPTESTPEISTINSVTLNCVGNESNVILPEFPGTTSGFDSAESTNDADFLTTRKAVLSAIDLMDEGLRDEEETRIEEESRINKSMNTKNEINRPISDDQCETIIDNELGTEKPKNCLVPGEMNNETSTATDNTNWSSSDLRDKKGDSKEKALSESNATDIEHDICKTSEIGETTSETLSETCKEKKDDDKNENIQPVNVNLIDLENVNDKTIGSKLEIDPSCHTHEDKNFAKLSVQNKSLDTGPVSKSSLDEEHHEKGEVSNSDNKNTDGDSKTEGHVSMVDISKETINKLEDSDDVIMLDEIDSEAKKSQDETALPVSVEIDDVEVSVFKYEKNKADKSQIKEEFKLDDMVLSSDEDSDDSQPCKDRLPILSNTSWDVFNHTPNILGIEETILTQSNTVKSENTKLSETIIEPLSSNKKLDTEVMDVEEGDIIQDNCKSKKEEEISNMDVEESIEGSVQKAMSSKPNESEGSQNASSNEDFHKGDEKMASQSDSRYCKNDNEAQLLESDPESENASKSTATEGKTSEVNETDLENMLREALNKNEKFREHLSLEPSDKDSKKPLGSSDKKDAEVICLVDDDEDDVSKKKKPAAAVNCVNPNCMSGEDLSSPPAMFVLSYFGLKRAKGQQVCAECFNMVVEHQEVLCSLLQEKKPLLSADFPSHKDVILLDSDEESLSDNESNLSDDTMSVIRDNLDDVISDTLAKFDFDFQLRESCNILNNRLTKLEEEAREITNRYDDVQKSLDNFRKKIYEEFQQETREKEEVHFMECEIPPMPIIKSKLQNQLYNRELMNRLRKSQQERESREEEGEEEEEEEEQQTVQPTRTIATKKVSQISQPQMLGESPIQDVTFVRSETKCEPPPSLPPPGPLLRPRLRVGDLAYTMKVSYFSIWVHCRILEIIPRNPTENDSSTETYRVRLENVKKNAVRTVTGKYLAYPTPARVQLKVGVRVIAIFREEEDSVTKDNYYVGVVAEPPKSTNRYRYLVFFDDGYTQYCPHENILVVCACSKNVWEDIHPEPRDFIKNYLQQYPERPMVKLSRGQIVKVEWNGRWWIVRVLEVDGSLVKVHFDADKRTEWIYRGSTRLGPMFQELAAAKERQHGSLLRSRGFGGAAHHKSDMPYVEYTRGDGDGDNENKPEEKEKTEEPPVEEQAPAPRSVARKSTNKRPPEPVISNTNYSKPLLNQLPEGRLRQRKLKPKHRPLVFRPHQCSEACVSWTGYTPASGNRYDPLVKPLMYGFERIISTFKGKMVVVYRAPCGRLIRTQQEMLRYLRSTRSQLTIDLFDFDFWVNPLNEFEEGRTFGKIEDLSYGKENVSISCVNELDHSMPQYVQYMTARQPAKDVHLNLDPEFLVGCDCTDDCEDRSKCSCWQLTLQGKAYQPDGDLDPLFGYQYRRLPERIATGIYECNSRCKCSNTCQNRVAQQPLSCRLQLFKTLKKGWGIRCLHDIPRGAFICIYAGFLLTEQEANEGGKTYGDEYLAELDYIESVENLKEGYESEAKEPSDLDEDEMSQKDTMDIEYENNEDSDAEAEQGYTRRPGDIRLRLRRRTADEVEKESRRSKADDDAISISDEELDSVRKPKTFDANITVNENEDAESKYPSVRELYGPDENVYIMDAKTHGNIGRYLNHSCSPNVFVQNVFVDTHDLRFPWVAFFASQYIPAGTELTWDYNYDVGSVPGKVMLCYCGSNHCRGRLL